MSALVLVLAGTDHHPFDRMVAWADDAAVRHPEVHVVVQHGASRPPVVAEGKDFLGHDQLAGLLEAASVVVCHGGPGLITEAREAGHVPLCVPRDPALGEHVDAHQQRFAAMVGRVGVVREVLDHATFEVQLDAALAEGAHRGVGLATVHELRDSARAKVAAELDELLAVVRPQPRTRRRSHAGR